MKLFKIKKKTGKVYLGHKPEAGDRPLRDWEFMLVGFVVLVLVAVGGDVYLFYKINRGDFLPTDDGSQIDSETLNRKSLFDAQNFFDSRQKEYQDFLKATSTEIDPSI